MSRKLTLTATLGLCAVMIFQLACSQSQINRTVAALNALSPFVVSFHLGSQLETRILQGVSEGTAAFIVFRDNPTRGNLRNAIAVFESLVSRGVFKTGNSSIDSRLGPAIALVIFIMNTINPPQETRVGALRVGVDDSSVKVRLDGATKATIDRKLQELESLIAH